MIVRRHDYAGSWATGFVSPSVHVPATPQLTAHALGACAVPRKLRHQEPRCGFSGRRHFGYGMWPVHTDAAGKISPFIIQ